MLTSSFLNRRRVHTILVATAIAISIAIQGVASAHPGHGITPDGNAPTHYLVEPSHGISLAIVLVATLAAGCVIRHCATGTRMQPRS